MLNTRQEKNDTSEMKQMLYLKATRTNMQWHKEKYRNPRTCVIMPISSAFLNIFFTQEGLEVRKRTNFCVGTVECIKI